MSTLISTLSVPSGELMRGLDAACAAIGSDITVSARSRSSMRITGQESGPILRGWLQADKLFGLNTYANAKCTGSNKATQLWLYCSASGSQCRNQASKA